jgi:hypothetical protein
MDIIYEIIKRKKLGIDCTEAESAEIKGWLREMKLPFEQPTVADIQFYFPIEYGEYLTECEISEPTEAEKTFAKNMSELLYQMRIESSSGFVCSDENGNDIPEEYAERIVDDSTHSKIMHDTIYNEILRDVADYPENFATDANGILTYCPETFIYASAIDAYIENQYNKERRARLNIKYKVWVHIERIETDPETNNEQYFDEDECTGIAYRDTLDDAIGLQNYISDLVGEI